MVRLHEGDGTPACDSCPEVQELISHDETNMRNKILSARTLGRLSDVTESARARTYYFSKQVITENNVILAVNVLAVYCSLRPTPLLKYVVQKSV